MRVVLLTLFAMGFALAAPSDTMPKELEEGDASYVPSPKNDRERLEMQCSACLTTALEVVAAMRKIRKEFNREPHKLKEYHLLDAVSEICDNNALHMGLLRDGPSRKVTTVYANDANKNIVGKYAVVKGAWVTHLWQQACYANIDRFEDQLKMIYDDDGRTYHFCPQCASAGQKGRLHEAQLVDEQKADL